MSSNTLCCYFGHHRCASSWSTKIVKEVCDYTGKKMMVVSNEIMHNGDFEKYVADKSPEFLCFLNADRTYIKTFENFLGFHIIRDPRDIVVSSYFSHLFSHPTNNWPQLVEHRKKLQSVNKEEGLLLEIEFRRWSFGHLYNWDYSMENILELKMEEIIEDPTSAWRKIFKFLDILDVNNNFHTHKFVIDLHSLVNRIHYWSAGFFPLKFHKKAINDAILEVVVHRNRLDKLAGGRIRGSEDIKSHYRKGTTGDWENHFSDNVKGHFKDRYNDLLVKLGYEYDTNW